MERSPVEQLTVEVRGCHQKHSRRGSDAEAEMEALEVKGDSRMEERGDERTCRGEGVGCDVDNSVLVRSVQNGHHVRELWPVEKLALAG